MNATYTNATAPKGIRWSRIEANDLSSGATVTFVDVASDGVTVIDGSEKTFIIPSAQYADFLASFVQPTATANMVKWLIDHGILVGVTAAV